MMPGLTGWRRWTMLCLDQETAMKKKTIIETNPKKLAAICLNQPRVSREEMRRSVLAGIQSAYTQLPVKVS